VKGFHARAGSVAGFTHKRKGQNNQDSFVLEPYNIGGVPYLFGAVFDGCTAGKEGSRNEVGANLLSEFFRFEVALLLSANTPIVDVPSVLYQRMLGYMGSIVRSTVTGTPGAMWDFVRRHMLSTVLGFIVDSTTLVVFRAGDGVVIKDDSVTLIDENDKPHYPAYHLIDRRMLEKPDALPSTFDVMVTPLRDIARFAVTTDGLAKEVTKDPSFAIDGIWTYEKSAKAGLQWWLNKSANEHRFSDDCTIVAFEREPL
jgi:hypothetical protein